jgi:multidrug efflux pump subunit AcrA (membrane-fusion protein)
MKRFKSGCMHWRKWLLITTVSLFIFSCGNDQTASDTPTITGTPVQITHPKIMDFTSYIDLNANTMFLRKEMVRATFQGFIDKIDKNIGDEIHRGDLLVTLKTKESAADDSIRLKLGSELFSGSVKIFAHSDGVLTTLDYHSGDFVSEGEEIAVISNPSSLRITLNVPYAFVAKISPKSSCLVILPDGQTVPAKISKIIPSVDPASQTQTFLLMPEQRVDLPENLNVTARLPLQTIKNAVILPRSAVLSNETQDQFWLMKLVSDSIAERVNVQTGLENDSLIQIIAPVLAPSNRIISDGGFGLPDSANVMVMNDHE